MAVAKKPAGKRARPPSRARRIEKERQQFHMLLASNPNYFGTLPESPFDAVKKISGNTKYEELSCIGYRPRSRVLEATIAVKLPYGYKGGPCTDGSEEFVRFYVDMGSGWQDVGVAATRVHDLPVTADCAAEKSHPLSFVVGLEWTPDEITCKKPQLPKLRAILSWEHEPPPNQPNWPPVWGQVKDCHIQIGKSTSLVAILDTMAVATKVTIPPQLLEQVKEIEATPIPLPDPPVPPIPLLAEMYAKPMEAKARAAAKAKLQFEVEPHRFGLQQIKSYQAVALSEPTAYEIAAKPWAELGIELGDLVVEVDKTKGNVSYEELECLGLDNNLDQLVATYRVKKHSGYSGDLCSAGSKEYVAFWADWRDRCKWTYLGTVEVKAYDFKPLPGGGLCYAAALPVDLSKVRRPCGKPVVGRVRAVLSWNTPPSTTDPDDVPHWGNRIDRHVHVRPGPKFPGLSPNMTVIGGISVFDIDDVTGLTKVGARFVDNGLKADYLNRACPFGKRVVIRGLQFPGHRYRVQVREFGQPGWTTLVKKIWVTPVVGSGYFHHPHPDGYFSYLSHSQNFAGVLAYFDTSGDAKWQIRLQIEGVPGQADQWIQLDNTWPDADIEITSGAGSCGMFTPGTTISGTFKARDLYFRNYTLAVKGHPSANTPVPSSGSVQTAVAGDTWTLDTSGMAECGYIIEVVARDRAILNSIGTHHWTPASVGFCIRKKK